MTPTWFIITIAVIMAIGVTVAIRREDPFQSAARSLGLELTKRLPDLLPRLDGIINGLPVRIELKDKYAGGVDYTVFYPPLNLALRLERETTITRTLGQLGENDTQVGARVFDDSFRVNTSRPDALRSMMTPELRKALIDLIERYPRMVVSDGSMTLSSDSVEPTADEVTATIAQMAAAAHLLVQHRPPPLEKPSSLRPERTASPSQEEPTEHAGPAAAEPPVSVEPGEPAKPPPSVTTREAKPPTTPTGLPGGFFEEAFGDNRSAFESSDAFDREIQGTRVTLSGSVRHAREIETSGTDTATKATITVAQIDSALYGQTNIDAEVLLPAGNAVRLGRGDVVTFTGSLDRIDAFARTLYISDAERIS